MNAVVNPKFSDYKVADINLAPQEEFEPRRKMPGLMALREEYAPSSR